MRNNKLIRLFIFFRKSLEEAEDKQAKLEELYNKFPNHSDPLIDIYIKVGEVAQGTRKYNNKHMSYDDYTFEYNGKHKKTQNDIIKKLINNRRIYNDEVETVADVDDAVVVAVD